MTPAGHRHIRSYPDRHVRSYADTTAVSYAAPMVWFVSMAR